MLIVCNELNAMYVEGVKSNKETKNRLDLKYLLSCRKSQKYTAQNSTHSLVHMSKKSKASLIYTVDHNTKYLNYIEF